MCGGQMRLIAFITEGAQIRMILDHIGVDAQPPRISPARGSNAVPRCNTWPHVVEKPIHLLAVGTAVKITSTPSGVTFASTVFAFNMLLSKHGAFTFCQSLTRSLSALCIRLGMVLI